MRGVPLRRSLAEDQFELIAMRPDEGNAPFQLLAARRGEGLDVAFGKFGDGQNAQILSGRALRCRDVRRTNAAPSSSMHPEASSGRRRRLPWNRR